MNITNTMKTTIATAWGGSLSSVSIYTGTIPTAATNAPTGTKLVQLDQESGTTYSNGAVNFGTMSGTAVAAGTAGYACMGDSYSGYIYFTLGVGTGEFQISATNIAVGDIISGTASITAVH